MNPLDSWVRKAHSFIEDQSFRARQSISVPDADDDEQFVVVEVQTFHKLIDLVIAAANYQTACRESADGEHIETHEDKLWASVQALIEGEVL